jgi:hypothetical protein
MQSRDQDQGQCGIVDRLSQRLHRDRLPPSEGSARTKMCRSVRERCPTMAPPSGRECYMQLQVVSGCGPNRDSASDVPMHEHPRGQSDNFAWQPSYPALRLPGRSFARLALFNAARWIYNWKKRANNSSGHRLDALPYPVCRRDWSGRLTVGLGSVECCRGHKSWHASRRRMVGLLCDTRDSHAVGWPNA